MDFKCKLGARRVEERAQRTEDKGQKEDFRLQIGDCGFPKRERRNYFYHSETVDYIP
jgi:hypothetical protein